MKTYTNSDLKNLQSALNNFNSITAEDLKELEKVKKQKIIFTEDSGKYKVGDILDIKVFNNTHTSEPPSFFVVDEKLGSAKYGFGGRGYKPFFKEYKDALIQQNTLNNASNPVSKYVFNQDYEATTTVRKPKEVGDYTENVDHITIKYKFKKGDIFDGTKIPVNAGINPNARRYVIEIKTFNSTEPDGSIYKGLATYQIDDSIVSEATFIQKNKTNLLIAGALVLGYFAYKKFNK